MNGGDTEDGSSRKPLLNGKNDDSSSSDAPSPPSPPSLLHLLWTLAHGLMTIVFMYSGMVQLNDPDWFLWLIGYELTALTCAGLCLQSVGVLKSDSSSQLSQYMALGAGAAFLIHSYIYREHLDFSVHTETGREAMGLALVSVWMTLSWAATPSSVRSFSKKTNVGAVAIATMVLGFCTIVIVSIWAVPRFLLDANSLGAHCQGIGFGPEL